MMKKNNKYAFRTSWRKKEHLVLTAQNTSHKSSKINLSEADINEAIAEIARFDWIREPSRHACSKKGYKSLEK